MLKYIYLLLGFICLALGTVGIFIPLLPTVPFYLASAYFFAKSNERLHNWFISSKIYKKNIEVFKNNEEIPLKIRIKIIITVTILLGTGFYFMENNWSRVLIAVVWLGHIYFIGIRKRR